MVGSETKSTSLSVPTLSSVCSLRKNDAVNFEPVGVSSAVDTLEGPYLPLVILEAAGLPLDPSFTEQKNILRRCKGIFYACNGGAEARRFHRLLIDAGLIKQL